MGRIGLLSFQYRSLYNDTLGIEYHKPKFLFIKMIKYRKLKVGTNEKSNAGIEPSISQQSINFPNKTLNGELGARKNFVNLHKLCVEWLPDT